MVLATDYRTRQEALGVGYVGSLFFGGWLRGAFRDPEEIL